MCVFIKGKKIFIIAKTSGQKTNNLTYRDKSLLSLRLRTVSVILRQLPTNLKPFWHKISKQSLKLSN